MNKRGRMKGPLEVSYKRPMRDREMSLMHQAAMKEKSQQRCRLVFAL